MAKRLTEKMLEKLPVPKALRIIWDIEEPGLVIKLTPAGKKIWAYQKVYPGRSAQALRTLEGVTSLKEAREKARKWRDWIAKGIDPRDAEGVELDQEMQKARQAALKRASTFGSAAERYIAQRTEFRRAKDDAREIRRLLVGDWGVKPISSITPRDVREVIAKLKAHSASNAATAWGHASTLFKWAVHEELIETSPCASLDKKIIFKGAKLGPRQRVLDEEEIAALWRAARRLSYPVGPYYRLLLLTGLRKTELARAQWKELHPDLRRLVREAAEEEQQVDWQQVPNQIKLLTVPRERFKSDAEHAVPLSNEACAILETLPRFKNCDWIFTENGKAPINGFSKAKARLDRQMLRSLEALAELRGDDPEPVTLAPWVNHDLRRVVRTGLSALKVEDHVAEMILGHGRKGLQRIYDQHRYLNEMRDALEKWAARVREITEPKPPAPPRTTAGNVHYLSETVR